jgi:hypothetical protein
MNARDDTAIVQLQVRLREDLRRSLEEAAKAKRISLNQEIIDRLEYVRDRRSLLAEVLRLTFGDRLAGLLLAIGLALGGVVHAYGRLSPGVGRDRSHDSWIDDREFFDEAVDAAIVLLAAALPDGGEQRDHKKKLYAGWLKARQVLVAMSGGKPVPSWLPAKEIDAVNELLGPVAARMTALAERSKPEQPLRRLGEQVTNILEKAARAVKVAMRVGT